MTQDSLRSGNHASVRAFLDEAAIDPGFASRAFGLIEEHDAELGTSYLWRALSALASECTEAAEDLAAKCGLLAARLQHDGSPLEQRATAVLVASAQRAAEADRLLEELRRLVQSPS